MHVPTEDEIPESKPPPPAKNKQYQHLATIAESFVEKTWWRYENPYLNPHRHSPTYTHTQIKTNLDLIIFTLCDIFLC